MDIDMKVHVSRPRRVVHNETHRRIVTEYGEAIAFRDDPVVAS